MRKRFNDLRAGRTVPFFLGPSSVPVGRVAVLLEAVATPGPGRRDQSTYVWGETAVNVVGASPL